MHPGFKDYLTFSRSERRGLITLAILIMLLHLAPVIYRWLNPVEYSAFNDMVHTLQNQRGAREKPIAVKDSLFKFDPNRISGQEWQILGLPESTIRSINNYLKKGGRFYDKNDLLRIYNMDKKTFLRLEPYIAFQPGRDQPFSGHSSSVKPVRLDINMADSADWTTLRGIGPVYAGRIVKYRQIRKGFRHKSQLMEVYGLDSLLLKRISPHLHVDTQTLFQRFPAEKEMKAKPTQPRIAINKADSAVLLQLSGIGPVLAGRIIRYRDFLGGFASVSQLSEVYGLEQQVVDQIAVRLSVNPAGVRKININRDEEYILAAHPYLSRAMAGYIIRRRMQEPFNKPEDLLNSFLFDQEVLKKITPYLSF